MVCITPSLTKTHCLSASPWGLCLGGIEAHGASYFGMAKVWFLVGTFTSKQSLRLA